MSAARCPGCGCFMRGDLRICPHCQEKEDERAAVREHIKAQDQRRHDDKTARAIYFSLLQMAVIAERDARMFKNMSERLENDAKEIRAVCRSIATQPEFAELVKRGVL